MNTHEVKFMRLMVLFDLPTKSEKERKAYTKFRKFLVTNGFMMIQFSIYVRICKGVDAVQMYEDHIAKHIPTRGNIRTLTITNSQYERMNILLGTEKYEEKIAERQMVLF
jgi:CRISPR-associated protein Cas2